MAVTIYVDKDGAVQRAATIPWTQAPPAVPRPHTVVPYCCTVPREGIYGRGVYSITDSTNGFVYVGSTRNTFAIRWADHISLLRKREHSNRALQADWIKHGERAFVFAILSQLPDETTHEIRIAEARAIAALGTYNEKAV